MTDCVKYEKYVPTDLCVKSMVRLSFALMYNIFKLLKHVIFISLNMWLVYALVLVNSLSFPRFPSLYLWLH